MKINKGMALVVCFLLGSIAVAGAESNPSTVSTVIIDGKKYVPPSGAPVNQNHPERLNYEYWLTNSANCPHFISQVTNYKTVRCGNVALDVNDNPVEGFQPVFVKKYDYHTSYTQSVIKE